MIRSLFAIIIAVIAGLASAKFVEGGGKALMEGADTSTIYLLTLSWFVGAFVSASVALLIGQRWAPLGILAAATMFLAATLALPNAGLNWIAYIGAALATALGGFLALRIARAENEHPAKRSERELFND